MQEREQFYNGELTRSTSDLPFAAFAKMRGMRVIKAEESRRGRQGFLQYRFTFADPNGDWDTYHFEWANSESQQFDEAQRALKKLCKRN
jgi:hypothetical protein